MSKTKITYDKAMTELQSIVGDLQSEAVSIDDLSKKVNRAAELIKFCREKLRKTEAEVQDLF